MKTFTENLRYEYPLTPDDLVLDIGGFEGNFAATIHGKYGCRVLVFEPCLEFAKKIQERFKGNKAITVYAVAVGSEPGETKIGVHGDSTGMFATSDNVQSCPVVDIKDIVSEFGIFNLLKLNCEGGEFAILERILEFWLADKIKHFQIQFHPIVSDYEKRYAAICEGLKKTHSRTFYAPWCWEGWTIKS